MKVDIVSSRIHEFKQPDGTVVKQVMTTYQVDGGRIETITMPLEEWSEEVVWSKITEQVEHAKKIVGQSREI